MLVPGANGRTRYIARANYLDRRTPVPRLSRVARERHLDRLTFPESRLLEWLDVA
jgi:hypothetical protein